MAIDDDVKNDILTYIGKKMAENKYAIDEYLCAAMGYEFAIEYLENNGYTITKQEKGSGDGKES